MDLYSDEKRPIEHFNRHPSEGKRRKVPAGITHILAILLAISLIVNYKQWTAPLLHHPSPPSSPSSGSGVPTGTNHSDTPLSPSHDSPDYFDWDSLPTLPELAYQPCYNATLQCARLRLPMDYWNGSTDATISLAVVRQPAAVPITHPRYGGAVLLNPGGPGGSGVGLVQRGGKSIRETIDADAPPQGEHDGDGDDDRKPGLYYDLISFDPRGVGLTTPAVRCAASRSVEESWQVRIMEEGVLGSSDAALGRVWAMAAARGRGCSLPNAPGGGGEIRAFVSTASVARDLLELTEAHGRWRAAEAARMTADVRVRQRLRYRRGEEKIQYWGFSYGTYLGLTFASMFPDRIHRLIVDGVVDAEDYAKALWFDNLADTEKVMDAFHANCARVGYPTCALANEKGETTAEEVRRRVENITNSLYHNPLPVIGTSPEVITYSDVKNLIFSAVYTPQKSFPWVARLLSNIERGDGVAFADLLRPYHAFSCPAPSSGSSFHLIPLHNITANQKVSWLSEDATMAIACGDGDDLHDITREQFAQFVDEITAMSPTLGPMWAMIHLHCIHYHIRAKYRFTGPWQGNTSHPILLIGNTADPVTPLRNAIKFSKHYEGAVALTQDSPGHCSSSTSSRCTQRYIRGYFQTGELPAEGTVCEPDERPFGPGPRGEIVTEEVRVERQRSDNIWEALHQAGGGFMRRNIRGGIDV